MVQFDLSGNPALIIGTKDPDAVRQYPFSSKIIVLLNTMYLKSRIPKQDLVSDGILLHAVLMEFLPEDFIEKLKNKDPKTIELLNLIKSLVSKDINTLKPEDFNKIIQDILSKIKGI